MQPTGDLLLIFALRLRRKLKQKQIPLSPPFSKGEVLQPYSSLGVCESLLRHTDRLSVLKHVQESRYFKAVF